jgi:hypothetical protein
MSAAPRRARRKRQGPTEAELVLGVDQATLLDLVDNALTRGVVLTGDLTISLAHIDLVYLRLSLLLCAADRILPGEPREPMERYAARHRARVRVRQQLAEAERRREAERRSRK